MGVLNRTTQIGVVRRPLVWHMEAMGGENAQSTEWAINGSEGQRTLSTVRVSGVACVGPKVQ